MVVNSYSEEELTRLFRELGEEPAARRIASQLVKQRKTDAVPRYLAARQGRSRKSSGGTGAVIPRPRSSRRCAWK